jgi:hypothetical protein
VDLAIAAWPSGPHLNGQDSLVDAAHRNAQRAVLAVVNNLAHSLLQKKSFPHCRLKK